VSSIIDFAVTTTSATAKPIGIILPSSGSFLDILGDPEAGSGPTLTALSTTTAPFFAVVTDRSSGVASYPYSITATLAPAFYPTVSATPANISSDLATSLTSLPAAIDEGVIPDGNTILWFVYTATAADVGKSVHVQLVGGDGQDGTDMEVDMGTVAGTPTEQDGEDAADDLVSDPITAAGPIYVQFQPDSLTYDSTAPHIDAVIRLQ
jgi:hypothetical protein